MKGDSGAAARTQLVPSYIRYLPAVSTSVCAMQCKWVESKQSEVVCAFPVSGRHRGSRLVVLDQYNTEPWNLLPDYCVPRAMLSMSLWALAVSYTYDCKFDGTLCRHRNHLQTALPVHVKRACSVWYKKEERRGRKKWNKDRRNACARKEVDIENLGNMGKPFEGKPTEPKTALRRLILSVWGRGGREGGRRQGGGRREVFGKRTENEDERDIGRKIGESGQTEKFVTRHTDLYMYQETCTDYIHSMMLTMRRVLLKEESK